MRQSEKQKKNINSTTIIFYPIKSMNIDDKNEVLFKYF